MTEPVAPEKPLRPIVKLQAAPPAGAGSPGARAAKPPPVTGPWRPGRLLAAPHRLAFFLAMSVLVVASLWWAVVQVNRATGVLQLRYAVSPTLTHAAAMVLGFMPLFFAGFLFTAGPKWLNVQPYAAPQLLAPLGLQALGWWLWLAGAQLGFVLAVLGLALAGVGLAWAVGLYWRLVLASRQADRVHALVIGCGGLVGVLGLAGVGTGLLAGQDALALAWVRTALWGFVVGTFVSVAHRMIPFFTSGVLPMIEVWRPFWVLWLMVGVAAFEVLAVWVDHFAPSASAWPGWTVAVIVVETGVGGVLLWLAVVWGLVQSLKIRLLAMLHVGFMWLGLALLLSAASQALWLATGQAVLGLGALHALSMGFLGSTMLAMVTRVACGHSGRALVADDIVWALFWALQLATVVRIAAAVQGAPAWLTPAAALLWLAVVLPWSMRYGSWMGRPRLDGEPG